MIDIMESAVSKVIERIAELGGNLDCTDWFNPISRHRNAYGRSVYLNPRFKRLRCPTIRVSDHSKGPWNHHDNVNVLVNRDSGEIDWDEFNRLVNFLDSKIKTFGV